MLGALIAQFFLLEQRANPNFVIGDFFTGVPIASICHIFAIITALIGGYRNLRLQNELARGMIISGGWEFVALAAVTGLVSALEHYLHPGSLR